MRIIFNTIAATAGLFIAIRIVPGSHYFGGPVSPMVIAGIMLGLANYFLRPILKSISLPLRIITLGLWNIVIDMALLWLIIDIIFADSFEIDGIIALFYTALTIWISKFIFNKIADSLLKNS